MASDLDKRFVNNVNWKLNGQIAFFSWPDTIPPQEVPGDILRESDVANKEILFRDFLPVQEVQVAKGSALLQKLNGLAPSVAANFELKGDLVKDFTLRLINGEDSPESSYLALSYCWSDKYLTDGTIATKPYGSDVIVPFNALLFQAAIFERATANEGLWIDQICINQSDKLEVRKAIPAMATLYQHARAIIIAIEDVEVSEEEQLFLRKFIPEFENSGKTILERPYFGQRPPYMHENPILRGVYDKICSSRWFTRAWCSHEMRLGQRHIFMIPCATPGGRRQDTILSFSNQFMWYLSSLSSELPATSNHLRKVREMVKERFDIQKEMEKVRRILADKPAELDAEESYTLHIREVMELGSGGDPGLEKELRACDARCDKVSIVLNSVGNGLNLKRDGSPEVLRRYFSDDECYRQLFTLALAAGDPLALCCMGPPLNTGNRGSSWMCRPSPRDTGSAPESTPLPHLVTDNIAIDDDPSSHWIQLPGFLLREDSKPPQSCLTTAVSLVAISRKLGLGLPPGYQSSGRDWGPGPEYRFWRNQTDREDAKLYRFTMTVSSILHCGPKWMLETAKNCGFPPNHYVMWKKDATEFFGEEFEQDELSGGAWVESKAGWTGVDSLLRFALWLVTWGQETTHASFMGIEELWMPMIFPRDDGGKVLVFSDPMLSDDDDLAMVFEEMAVFVPSCLMIEGYERLGRCWILNHAKKGVELSDQLGQMSIGGQISIPDVLVRKARAFSDVPLTAEGSGWKEVNPMKVYGSG